MIRYFRFALNNFKFPPLYAAVENTDCGYFLAEDGDILVSVVFTLDYMVGASDQFEEVYDKPGICPDAGPIEERYINATDRPSLDRFKYGVSYV